MSSRLGVPIAVLGSGRGSNFDAILGAIREGRLEAEIQCVISDQPAASVLEKARAEGIPALTIPPITQDSAPGLSPVERRKAHEREILRQLSSHAPRFLVLAGYMRILTPVLLDAFDSGRGYRRIVNVHPSLLPAFPGVDAYRQAFESDAKTTGVTVHLVDEGVDTGPICAQERIEIADCLSVEEVVARGLAVEHRIYPETLAWVLPEKFQVEFALGPSSGVSSGASKARAKPGEYSIVRKD